MNATNIQVHLAVHNSASEPVVIRSVGVQYKVHPRTIKVKKYAVLFGEQVTGQDPAVVLALMERKQDDGTPIDVIDEFGHTIESIVESVRETEREESSSKGFSVHAELSMSTTRSPALFDVDLWDVAEWS